MIGLHRSELRIEPHQSGWADIYEGYRARIQKMFKRTDVKVEHVGSTSVSELTAKPVIDIAVSVPSGISDSDCCTAFEASGFAFGGDQGGQGGLLFYEESAADIRTCHIHVYHTDDPQWERTLCFRDLLRRDGEARVAYESIKRKCVNQGMSRQEYLAYKSDFVSTRSGVFQNALPEDHKIGEGKQRLPGVTPLDLSDWLQFDEAFNGQMALRDRLITNQRDDVVQLSTEAKLAADELLDILLQLLSHNPGYNVAHNKVLRPDGVFVVLDKKDPLGTLGRLVQEDFCILQKLGNEHVLTGAVLCFPASWSLMDKFMKPLGLIHQPVGEYDENIGKRVQRMFDMMRFEQPLWRSNVLIYDEPTLHTPYAKPVRKADSNLSKRYVRSERQSLVKLLDSSAIVFSIHTFLVQSENLTEKEKAVLIQ